jgi:hypothetical protein
LRRHEYTVDVLGNAPGLNYAPDYRTKTTAFGTSKMAKKRLSKPSFKEVLAKYQVGKIFNKN